jgi:transposase-like protein
MNDFDLSGIPDGRIHCKLADPEWQKEFRIWTSWALQFRRERLENARLECFEGENHASANGLAEVHLIQLRWFLVRTAADAGPEVGFAIDLDVRRAYNIACDMFKKIGAKREVKPNRETLVFNSLTAINELLNGRRENVANAIEDAAERMRRAASQMTAWRKAAKSRADKPVGRPRGKTEELSPEKQEIIRLWENQSEPRDLYAIVKEMGKPVDHKMVKNVIDAHKKRLREAASKRTK